jgi:chromate transporter
MPRAPTRGRAWPCASMSLHLTGSTVTNQTSEQSPDRYVSMRELSVGFLLVGLLGFGGLSASGFYVIVERNQWLNRKDYVELFGFCSILPGGNILNASVVLGDRYQGPLGSIVAISSLMLAPLAILMSISVIYDQFSHLPDVKAAAAGAASAVAGMTIGSAAKMAHGLLRSWATPVFVLATFVAIAWFRLPLAMVVLTIVPLAILTAIYLAHRQRRSMAGLAGSSTPPESTDGAASPGKGRADG